MLNATDKLLADIEETSRKMDAKLKRRVKECGVSGAGWEDDPGWE